MPNQRSNYFPLRLELDYSYSFGQLAPYFEALSNGQALGSLCCTCGQVNFPPRLICDKDGSPTQWHQLSGKGEIIEKTTGYDSQKRLVCFAMIAMDGAHNLALGRIEEVEIEPSGRVEIVSVHTDTGFAHPARSVIFRGLCTCLNQ